MTRQTRIIVASALAGAAALGIGGIAAAQESNGGSLTVTETPAPVLAQTDPTTPADDGSTDSTTADDSTDPAPADDATNPGERGPRPGGPEGCNDGEGSTGGDGSTGTDGTGGADAGSSVPVPAPAETVPVTDPASEA